MMGEERNVQFKDFIKELRQEVGMDGMRRNLWGEMRNLTLHGVGSDFNRYLERFQSIINRLANVPEENKVYEFIDGLYPKMQQHVLSFKPVTLGQAIDHARVAYDCYGKGKDKGNVIMSTNYAKTGFRKFNRPKENRFRTGSQYGKGAPGGKGQEKPNNEKQKGYGNTNNGSYNGNANYNKNSEQRKAVVCYNCNKPGHTKSQCRLRKANQAFEVQW